MLKTRQSSDSETTSESHKNPKKDVDNGLTLLHNASVMQKQRPQHLAIRPNREDWKLLDMLSAKTGLVGANLIRLALRRLAEKEGLKVA